METFKIEGLSFKYPERETETIKNLSLSVVEGEFVTICGKSGCGKTTLVRLLKPSVAPSGEVTGEIMFNGSPVKELDVRKQAEEIGFVTQNPENQTVTDKVWHELAFGLESLGYPNGEIRTRVAEMASYFGISNWFRQKTSTLSGGQKQLLNLASVMVMQPKVLILDEPTSQLDPIAASEFIKTLEKINRELGTTVILTEHRLEDAFSVSDRVVVMEKGEIIAQGKPQEMAKLLKDNEMYYALPTPMRVYSRVENDLNCPLTVRDGRKWLEAFAKETPLKPLSENVMEEKKAEVSIEMKDVFFRYEKEGRDVVKGLNLKVKKGELYAIVGGNAAGKTTCLSLISGLNSPYRGKVYIEGKEISKIENLYSGVLGVLPQNPQSLFVKKTVYLDLEEMLSDKKMTVAEKEKLIMETAESCDITEILESHPYDLSGGEQQRAALAKILLKKPGIILLDEPTKGMDAPFKNVFANILKGLKKAGVTIVMVSHDIEFCAENADRCAMFFDGEITSEGAPREFFAGKNFYTTAANAMARKIIKNAVVAEDIIKACGGEEIKQKAKTFEFEMRRDEVKMKKEKEKLSPLRIFLGCFMAIAFLVTFILGKDKFQNWKMYVYQFVTILELGLCIACFVKEKELGAKRIKEKGALSKRTLLSALFVLVAVPLTVFAGIYLLDDKKYYFISMLIILETLIPFCVSFENRKPNAREMVIISVLCAIAVAGRSAFYMLPQFKPVLAIIIISGVCFGGETGFLVGAVAAFVSNFFFVQGSWTPWQMFSMGMVGFVAGVVFNGLGMRKTRLSLCIFGGLATFFIFGGIMNPASVLMWQPHPTWEMIVSAYAMGLPSDLIHSASTVFFLWFAAEPMIDKLERIKSKYGIMK